MAVTSRPIGAARPWGAPRLGAGARGDTTRLRVLWLLVISMLLAGSVWSRLVYWQVVEHGRITRMAAAYHLLDLTLPAARGEIRDRDGNPLAIETTVYDVTLSPRTVPASDRA